MTDKKAQAIIKRDTLENWEKAENYIPMNGVIIVIDSPDGGVQLKLGNGKNFLKDLPNILESNSLNTSVNDGILEIK